MWIVYIGSDGNNSQPTWTKIENAQVMEVPDNFDGDFSQEFPSYDVKFEEYPPHQD